jgi:lysophospholipase L1-like esterase
MPGQIRRRFQSLFFALASAAFLSASVYAAPLAVHKVATPPALTPLRIATGGRMLVTPSDSPNSFGSKDYTSEWPGSYFRAAFRGTTVFFRVVKGDEILHIVVDGEQAAPLVQPEPGVYAVDGLSQGKHEISVLVATESDHPDTFGGFALPSGEKPLAPPRRRRQIEFIGDSFTVGYGNLSKSQACTHDQVVADTDDTQAFGALTADHYDADYQINASSGRGVVRNYNGSKSDVLLDIYPYVLFDKKQLYHDPTWKPQVIVIGLGTNDFSTPLHAGEPWKTRDELHSDYEKTYVRFLEGLRQRDPKALLIVWATDTRGEVEAESAKVVQQMKAHGDRRIVDLPINGLRFSGCDGHPSLADHLVIAGRLEQIIDANHIWQNQ